MKNTVLVVFGVIGLLLLSVTVFYAANSETEKAQTEQRVVELNGAKSVRVKLMASTADIKLGGGAEKLLEGTFKYNRAVWKPELNYTVNREQGELTLRQPYTNKMVLGRAYCNWDLVMSNSVLLDLDAQPSTGDIDLDLSKLKVAQLKVDASTGDIRLDISGNHQQLSLINAASATGDIVANLNGNYEALSNINLNSSTGDINIDLSGGWTKDAGINVSASTGDITIKVPSKTGARISVRTSTGHVNAQNLKVTDHTYVNSAYDSMKATLNITAKSSTGDIHLQVVD